MIQSILILLGGFVRSLDGEDRIPKSIVIGLISIFIFIGLGLPTTILLNPLTIVAAVAIGYGPGWGKYFSSFTGIYRRNEKEVLPIDLITDFLHDLGVKGYYVGTIGMSLRWLLCFLPLAFIVGNLHLAPIMLVPGLIYHSIKYIGVRYFNQIEFFTGLFPMLLAFA